MHVNKQVVLHIMRDLLEAGHWSDAPKYLSERYIGTIAAPAASAPAAPSAPRAQ